VAASVFLLAQNTGWSLPVILWDLPLVLLNQAEHVFLWHNGVRLRRPGRMHGQDKRDIEQLLGI
jgi:hypothetical protein